MAGGDYETAQIIEITSDTPDTTIRYTLDGSNPSSSYGLFYTGPLEINEGFLTIKAIAYKEGFLSSNVVSQTYLVGTLNFPQFSIEGGLYALPQSVVLSPSNEGASVFYTTDGLNPVCNESLEYAHSPVLISESLVLKAISCKVGYSPSPVKTETYYIGVTGVAEKPSFSVAGGTYQDPFSITINTETSSGTIRYTINGANPTSGTGILYDPALPTPIAISENSLVKAVAYRDGFSPSLISAVQYRLKVKTPTFSKSAGNYLADQSLTLQTDTAGSTIYYTTDGSIPVPGENGEIYTEAIVLNKTQTIKALAIKPGWDYSDMIEANYNLKVADPVIDITPKYATNDLEVTLTSSTSNAAIYYTTNGSEVNSTNGTLYTGTFSVSMYSGPKIRVIAYKTGCETSATTPFNYNLPQLPNPVFKTVLVLFGLVVDPFTGGAVGIIAANSGPSTLMLYSTEPGVTIRYTLNGTEPTESNGSVYNPNSNNGYISFPSLGDFTVKARAFKTGFVPSEVNTISVSVTRFDIPSPF